MKDVFDQLWSVAWSNDYELQSRHAAAIFHKNSIVSIGVNSLKTHPLQLKYAKNNKAIHLHAEIDSIVRALRHISTKELEQATLFVTRVKYYLPENKSYLQPVRVWGNSEPCNGCKAAVEAFNINRVVYTIDTLDQTPAYEVLER